MNLLGLVEAAATVFKAFGAGRPAELRFGPLAGVRILFCRAVPGVRPPAWISLFGRCLTQYSWDFAAACGVSCWPSSGDSCSCSQLLQSRVRQGLSNVASAMLVAAHGCPWGVSCCKVAKQVLESHFKTNVAQQPCIGPNWDHLLYDALVNRFL